MCGLSNPSPQSAASPCPPSVSLAFQARSLPNGNSQLRLDAVCSPEQTVAGGDRDLPMMPRAVSQNSRALSPGRGKARLNPRSFFPPLAEKKGRV